MNSKYRAIILTVVVVLIAGFMMKHALFQPGIQALPGGFEETAFIRNEQNKGGIVRVYAISVANPQQADYLTCGNRMPHNDYGSTTTVYFFDKHAAPEVLQLDDPHFDRNAYHPIAIYVKNENGVASVEVMP